MKSVQKTFFYARIKRRMSARDVAQRLGCSHQTISMIENEKKRIISQKTPLLHGICELYGLNEAEVRQQIQDQVEQSRSSTS